MPSDADGMHDKALYMLHTSDAVHTASLEHCYQESQRIYHSSTITYILLSQQASAASYRQMHIICKS